MRSSVRFLVLWAAVVSFGFAAAVPAAADRPVELTATVTTEEFFGAYLYPGAAFNACTGEYLPEIAVDITALNHESHPNTYVSVHGTRAVNADDPSGYTLRGADRVVFSYVNERFSWVVNDTWTSPDGARFMLHMRVFDDGTTPEFPDGYSFTGHCLGGETILPST